MGYKQGKDNGVLNMPSTHKQCGDEHMAMCFPSLVAHGDNPNDFNAYTPNGVSRAPKDTLIHKDNYGDYEDGAHWEWPPCLPVHVFKK